MAQNRQMYNLLNICMYFFKGFYVERLLFGDTKHTHLLIVGLLKPVMAQALSKGLLKLIRGLPVFASRSQKVITFRKRSCRFCLAAMIQDSNV